MDIPAFGGLGDAPTEVIDYGGAIRAAQGDPRRLEDLYQAARRAGQAQRFGAALLAINAERPDDTLYLAWRYRLESADDLRAGRLGAGWRTAISLGVVLAVVYWATADPTLTLVNKAPAFVFLWPPLAALAIIWFLALAGSRSAGRMALAAGASVALAAVVAYVYFIPQVAPASSGSVASQGSYLDLMLAHVPMLAWAAVALVALGLRFSAHDLFGLLTKSLEAIGVGGVYAIAGVAFIGLTMAMFQTLSVPVPNWAQRVLIGGVVGLLPALAVASVYDPLRRAGAQDFYRGFGKTLAVVMRLLLPLTLLTLLIYLAFVPFNFFAPFYQRNVLITYNVGLFAVMGLLVGVIPLSAEDVSPRLRRWLRAGIVTLAALALLVSLYALSAIVYRATQDGLTMNRVAVIGWNAVNIALLGLTLLSQARAGASAEDGWVVALQRVARGGALAYVVWGLALTLALPWVF